MKIYSIDDYEKYITLYISKMYPNANSDLLKALLDFAMDNFRNGVMHEKGALNV